ncbi:MAG TPA: hypothetical protein VGK25_12315 [Ignavibacteria bacterium]
MQALDIIISISEIILILALTVLAVYLIVSTGKIASSITKIECEITKTTEQIEPVIANLSVTINEINAITEITKKEIRKIEALSTSFTEKGYEILDNVENINRQLGKYVHNGVNFFSAVTTGVKTFSKKLKEKDYEHSEKI